MDRNPVYYTNVTNIIARINCPDQRKKNAVMISSHWDTGVGSPGASDDGIGVVAIIEILNLYAHNPQLVSKLQHDVIFMWNGGEELGSNYPP